MKIDSSLIRSERESRGWSQEHLASVAGLSLRTIQRIENTGAASLDSAAALASVLELDVAALRAGNPAPLQRRAIRVSLELPLKLALALLSGVFCALQFRWSYLPDWGSSLGIGFDWIDFAIAGTVFGLAVLCPYLRPGRGLVIRALGLSGGSALAYALAMTAPWSLPASELTAYMLASFTGFTIVLVAVKILVPLRVTAAFWLLGVTASLVGGAIMYAGLTMFDDTSGSTIISFCIWHMLVCISIDRGRHTGDAQSGLVAAFARARGRFSIVPGWLKLAARPQPIHSAAT